MEQIYETVTAEIVREFRSSTVTVERMNCLEDTFKSVRQAISSSEILLKMIGHSQPSLEIYGSCINSLAQQADSDLDLTLLIDDFDINHELILKWICEALANSGRFECPNMPIQIQSGVLLSVKDKLNQIEVDITINKTMEVLNSHLVSAYGSYDTRFVKLALYLKAWNKSRFPDKMKRLNSFSIYLMLIAFLQQRGVLPNLQALAPQSEPTRFQLQTKTWEYVGWADAKFVRPAQFNTLIDLPRFYETMGLNNHQNQKTEAIEEVKQESILPPLAESIEKISVGQLLLEFFEFYGFTFQNEKYAIDIRNISNESSSSLAGFKMQPHPAPFRTRQEYITEAQKELGAQTERNSQFSTQLLFLSHQYQMYLMADPFNRSYNPAKVQARSDTATAYKNAFRRAFIDLKQGAPVQ